MWFAVSVGKARRRGRRELSSGWISRRLRVLIEDLVRALAGAVLLRYLLYEQLEEQLFGHVLCDVGCVVVVSVVSICQAFLV